MNTHTPNVEFLFWPQCPSHGRALGELRRLMAELGMVPDHLAVVEVATQEAAARLDFAGSPTVRIDGIDIAPPEPGSAPSLSCRIYRRRDGRITPTPDPEDLRDALQAAGSRTADR